jgi:hypothetical protein
MTAQRHEIQLARALENGVDAYDSYFDNSADSRPIVSNRVKSSQVSLAPMKGNPQFSAQYDIKASIYYFSYAAGVFTPVLPANVPAGLQGNLPVYLFGWNDFKAGFPKLKSQYPIVNWVQGRAFLYGYDNYMDAILTGIGTGAQTFVQLDTNVTPSLSLGDLVIPFTATSGGTTYFASVVIHCAQVAYATLFESLVSDTFVMNMIRYIVPDTTQNSINQFINQIGLYSLSLYGKFNSDFVSPNSFKKPEQYQPNIIDIPIKKGVDKAISFGTYLNCLCTSFTWSTFVWSTKKLAS